ncbi:MAG TPA: hypothetical protein VHY08_16240 [Bacillota bacterium]|nr:hypothetical protein [Bacillota bacterium]
MKLAFTMTTNSGNKTREKFEEIAKQEWDAIGCKTSIQNYEAATFFGDILENFKFDMAIFAWVSGVDPDCLTLWHSKQIPTEANGKQGQNYVSYINPRIDSLVEQGQVELNQAKRIKIYQEVQQILAEDVPYMFVYYYNEVNAVNGALKNFKPNATQASSFWNVAEWELK